MYRKNKKKGGERKPRPFVIKPEPTEKCRNCRFHDRKYIDGEGYDYCIEDGKYLSEMSICPLNGLKLVIDG